MIINKNGFFNFLLKNGKTNNYSWDFLAQKYGFANGESARHAWKKVKNNSFINNKKKEFIQAIDEYTSKINKETGLGEITFVSTKHTLTDTEIYKECKMDPSVWVLTQIWHKKRATGFVYSANFKLLTKKDTQVIGKNIEDILTNYKTKYVPITKQDIIQNTKFIDPVAVYISLTDSHLDRLTTNKRSFEDATQQYLDTVQYLTMKAYSSFLVEEIVYVIGNDLFDSDTYYNETTDGTQQHSNVMYDVSYEGIFAMQVKAISKMKQFCNKLHIKFVPGNHDRTKGYFLVHALEVYFKSDKNIIFDRAATNTKVYTYGQNFIGMHHGDTKPESLPLYFATKYSKEWGPREFKEIGLGDKHVKRGWELKIKPTEDEYSGVRIFMTPSLCDNSLWEKNKLYDTSISAGICRIYSKTEGKVGEYERRLHLKK